ncbi:GNAT family N-acetyltransferase [Ilumatobacter nonamiensis]|uniref:GNAT family N-acetyltransferase n=1 Tax=Ilumatobacter nonamiensis TaxID=467093 RepID=UPI00034B9EE5|nr:GNAT family N-acetyltransferase [Ilumatobacter nonamiensis]
MHVELAEITADNVGDVYDLVVAPGQDEFVASNPWSLAQAYAERHIAWPQAVVVDSTVVGFIMLQFDPDDDDGRPYQLWRLMIGADHQGKGYGRAALMLAAEECRRRGATELFTSWVLGDGGPEGFYIGLGFVPTGDWDEDEKVARLTL